MDWEVKQCFRMYFSTLFWVVEQEQVFEVFRVTALGAGGHNFYEPCRLPCDVGAGREVGGPVTWGQRGKMAALWCGGREGRRRPCGVGQSGRRLCGGRLPSVKGERRCGAVTTCPTGGGSRPWGWRHRRRAPLEAASTGPGLCRLQHPPQGHRSVMEDRRVSRGFSCRKEQVSLA